MNEIQTTIEELKKLGSNHESIVVFYSGGKDSLCIVDLCTKFFKKVICVFMYFVPGLNVIEKQLQYARDRWNVKILQYPHWILIQALKTGAYCNSHISFNKFPDLKLRDIYNIVKSDTGINLIATGAKEADGTWRKYNLHCTDGYNDIIYPIKKWNKFDVLYYLRKNDIPLPDSNERDGRGNTGIDLSASSVLWLHDKYHSDYLKLLEYFPFAECIIKRREYYGIK